AHPEKLFAVFGVEPKDHEATIRGDRGRTDYLPLLGHRDDEAHGLDRCRVRPLAAKVRPDDSNSDEQKAYPSYSPRPRLAPSPTSGYKRPTCRCLVCDSSRPRECFERKREIACGVKSPFRILFQTVIHQPLERWRYCLVSV